MTPFKITLKHQRSLPTFAIGGIKFQWVFLLIQEGH